MFVFGHVYTVSNARKFRNVDLAEGEGVIALMLPDLLSSHDWGYEKCWNVHPNGKAASLIQAHMIGDSVVHYGSKWNDPRFRKGWAYKHMLLITEEYHSFFEKATEARYLISKDKPRDSVRGWAHTMVEYTVDQYLADNRNLSKSFITIRKAFQTVHTRLDWIDMTVKELGIEVSKPYPLQPLRYADVLARSEEPDEFHLRGLAAKFGLSETADVISWLRSILRRIISSLGRDEMEDIIQELSKVVENPINYGYPLGSLTWPTDG